MFNKITLCLPIVLLSTSTLAADPKIAIKGSLDFQTGYYSHNETAGTKKVSAHKDYFAFNSNASLNLDANNQLDSGFIYGAKIGILTSAKNTRTAPSFIYIISDAGKIELGSGKSAVATMKITGYSNACATAGLWDVWMRTDPANKGGIYITNFGNFLDAKTRHGTEIEYARKITYYTPEFKNFQIGISYIPDTSNTGYSPISEDVIHNPTKMKYYEADIKDGFGVGLSYHHEFNEDAKIRTSVVGEKGKTVGAYYAQPNRPKQPIKLSNLKTYTLGAEFIYQQFSLAGSYANYMKSLTNSTINTLGLNTDMYSISGRYNFQNDISSSLTYFTSNHQNSKLHATTLAFDYKIAKGVLPYVEFTYYETGGCYNKNGIKNKDKHSGFVGILGTKLEF